MLWKSTFRLLFEDLKTRCEVPYGDAQLNWRYNLRCRREFEHGLLHTSPVLSLSAEAPLPIPHSVIFSEVSLLVRDCALVESHSPDK